MKIVVAVALTFLTLWCVSHEVRLHRCGKPAACCIAVPMHEGKSCHCGDKCPCCPDCPSRKKAGPKCKASCTSMSEPPAAILDSGRLGTCNCEDCDCCGGCHR